MAFELQKLPCIYDVLEPNIDAQTMGIHHDKHHATYTKILKKHLQKQPLTRFGSGWAWLVKQGESWVISSTPNQDSLFVDLAEVKGIPVFEVDVGTRLLSEYQNRHPDYVDAFFNVVNWNEVARRFKG